MEKLSNPKVTIEIIQKYNFAFQKRFGQNFLIDGHVIEKIIRAAEITKDDVVLEIGPGIGTMTQYLAEAAGEVFAVEIDKNLLPILAETLAEYDNVTVVNEDILKVDIAALTGGRPVKVVANLPYYITTPIIMGLFENHIPHGHGAKGGCRADAGRSGRQGLWCIVACGAVLCGAVYRGKCTTELFYAASECRFCGNPVDKTYRAENRREG